MKLRWLAVALLAVTVAGAYAQPLAAAYREAVVALQAGEAAKAIAALDPAVKAAAKEDHGLPLAKLALGIAKTRTGATTEAVPLLEEAAAHFQSTPQAVDALAFLGDALRASGRVSDAKAAYARAAEMGQETTNGCYADARLMELRGEAAEAERRYVEAAGHYLAAGDALLALAGEGPAYIQDAAALFTKVAQGRDWRGEATARAVFSMGEAERAAGRLPEAIAYYQRTFVSWLRYPQWCARAYLRAAECMDKLGRRTFAIRHLREMVRKVERYGKLPEYEQAKAQLRAWGEIVR